eukprot:GHVT01058910.1.p1 GENE.GHVT01058910.1~~GHVT01058910.1.p1  ORF type:complete len:237 (-),score=22.93 GHVT01058910.1:324-1034(-)
MSSYFQMTRARTKKKKAQINGYGSQPRNISRDTGGLSPKQRRKLAVRIARGIDAVFPHTGNYHWTDYIDYESMENFSELGATFAQGQSILKDEMKLAIYHPMTGDSDVTKAIWKYRAKRVEERKAEAEAEAAALNQSSEAKSEISNVSEPFNATAAILGIVALASVAAITGVGVRLVLRMKDKKAKGKRDSVMKQRVAKIEAQKKSKVTDVMFSSKLAKSKKTKTRASTDSSTKTQ